MSASLAAVLEPAASAHRPARGRHPIDASRHCELARRRQAGRQAGRARCAEPCLQLCGSGCCPCCPCRRLMSFVPPLSLPPAFPASVHLLPQPASCVSPPLQEASGGPEQRGRTLRLIPAPASLPGPPPPLCSPAPNLPKQPLLHLICSLHIEENSLPWCGVPLSQPRLLLVTGGRPNANVTPRLQGMGEGGRGAASGLGRRTRRSGGRRGFDCASPCVCELCLLQRAPLRLPRPPLA
jgi:hypothetical protein